VVGLGELGAQVVVWVVDLAVDYCVDRAGGGVVGLRGGRGEVVDGEAVVGEAWITVVSEWENGGGGRVMGSQVPTEPSSLIQMPLASGPRWAIRSRLLLSLLSRSARSSGVLGRRSRCSAMLTVMPHMMVSEFDLVDEPGTQQVVVDSGTTSGSGNYMYIVYIPVRSQILPPPFIGRLIIDRAAP
jgi:hypothetical protein